MKKLKREERECKIVKNEGRIIRKRREEEKKNKKRKKGESRGKTRCKRDAERK